MKRRGNRMEGGLFPEDRRRTKPVPSVPAKDTTPESDLRSRILSLLRDSYFQAAVTDSMTVKTPKGKRQLVYPAGWPDVTASIPVTARAWAIEVKTADGEFRPSQEAKLAELEAAGWLVTRAVGEQGFVDVENEIRRQLDLLERDHRREFHQYIIRLRQLRSEAASKAAEAELRARTRPRRNSPPPV